MRKEEGIFLLFSSGRQDINKWLLPQHQTSPFPDPLPPTTPAYAYLSIDPYNETSDSHETTFQIPKQPLTNGNDSNFEDQLTSGVDLFLPKPKKVFETRNLGHCGAIPGAHQHHIPPQVLSGIQSHWTMLGLCEAHLSWIPALIIYWQSCQDCPKCSHSSPSWVHSQVSLTFTFVSEWQLI